MVLLEISLRPPGAERLAGLPVVVIGAGPVGLAAAANLIARGIDAEVLEAGADAAAAVRRWGHTRLFSPWRHVIDPASRRLLEAAGWSSPDPDRVPTGAELVRDYLQPLADLPEMTRRIRYGARVVAVTREGMDRTRTAGRERAPFLVRLRRADGGVEEVLGRAVIDASGTFSTPNPLASSGLEPVGAGELDDLVLPALPDVLGAERARFIGRRTTVVGAGHSAATTLVDLARLADEEPGTTIVWLIRGASAVRTAASPGDELTERARSAVHLERLVEQGRVEVLDRFQITDVAAGPAGGLTLTGIRDGEPATHETDLVVTATGFRPDLGMLREVRLSLDEVVEAPVRLAPLIDPNVHSCGTVEPHGVVELTHPDAGFFLAGMKSYGRAPTFLLATGYEQVRSIVAWLAGDVAAATRVELTLPATGVCSTAPEDRGRTAAADEDECCR